MWPRYIEILLGIWLIASAWLLPDGGREWLQGTSIVGGALTLLFAALSFIHRTRWAHLGTGFVALALGGAAYSLVEHPGPPAAQNQITVAILLLMFFLLPNRASLPPEPWRRGSARVK
jgi:hypothetical protein